MISTEECEEYMRILEGEVDEDAISDADAGFMMGFYIERTRKNRWL